MDKKNKKIVVFDLWETLIIGAKNSAISVFYNEITGEEIKAEQIKRCMLINKFKPREFLEKFLHIVTPSNHSAMLLSLNNPRSPLYEKIIPRFNQAIAADSSELRWVPGAVELLESLKCEYKLVLVSNLWAYQKNYLLNNLGLNRYFDNCFFSCDLGMNKEDILIEIPKLLESKVEDIVFVGRSYEYDIIPAVNAHLSSLRINSERNLIDSIKIRQLIKDEFSCESGAEDFVTYSSVVDSAQKVLIVIPPFYKLLGSHNNRMNLGATYLSAYLSAKGIENKIYHCDSEPHENYVSRFQMVFNSIHFYKALDEDKSFGEFEQYLRSSHYDSVFVTCGDILNPSFDSGNWDSTQKIAKLTRKILPMAFITAFGPETGVRSDDFDLIVSGEIEKLADSVLTRKLRGNVCGELLPEAELRDFPQFNIKNVVTEVSPVSLDTIIWRRGCVGTCDFCRVAQVNKGRVRARSIDSVISEIRDKHAKFKIKNFYIVDANFTSDKKSVKELCLKMKKEFKDITWRTESRFDTLDEELLAIMSSAGCTHLKLGLENALHEKHQVKTKKVDLERTRHWIQVIRSYGIKCIVYLLLGGKWFSPEQYNQMYKNAVQLDADGYTVSLFNPYPNTPAGLSYDEWEKRKFIGSHLDIRLVDFWKIPIDVLEAFFNLELKKGREDKNVRVFVK